MEKKSSFQVAVMAFELVMIFVAVVGNIYLVLLNGIEPSVRFCAGVTIVALLSAFIYLFNGATKDEATYYKIFMAFFALSELGIVALASSAGMLDSVINAVCYGLVIIMAVKRDLGKKISLILCAAIVAIRIYGVVEMFLPGSHLGALNIIHAIAELVLAVVFAACVIGKYRDKARRGTN